MASPTCRLSDIPIPPQCRDLIERGALVAVNSSGGKDSQCMTILLSRLVPREQLLVVHAPLGTVEWPGTIEHVENTIPPGLPLVLARTASWKTLLERIEKRGRFPDSGRRYFTSDHKRSPIERELRHYLKAHPQFGGRLVNAMGMRAEESAARAGKLPWRRSDLNSRAGRSWFDWLPIFGTRANRRIPHTGWECRVCRVCSASWPRAPISAPPRDCSRRSTGALSALKSASATRSRRPGCRCRF